MKQKIRSHIAIICRLRKSFLQFKQQVLEPVSKQISKQVLSRLKLSKLLFRAYDELLQLCLVSYLRTAPPVIFSKLAIAEFPIDDEQPVISFVIRRFNKNLRCKMTHEWPH